MKKKFLRTLRICFSIIALSGSVTAQEFKLGDNILSLGLGFGSSFGSTSYTSQSPAISIQYERGQWGTGGPGTISIGGFLGYKSFKYSYPSYYTEKWNYTVLGVRSAYHYTGLKVEHLDVYGGVMLAYNFVNYTFNSESATFDDTKRSYDNSFGLTLYIGGKYYFSNDMAGFLEISHGISFYVTLGGSYRF